MLVKLMLLLLLFLLLQLLLLFLSLLLIMSFCSVTRPSPDNTMVDPMLGSYRSQITKEPGVVAFQGEDRVCSHTDSIWQMATRASCWKPVRSSVRLCFIRCSFLLVAGTTQIL